MKVAEVGNGPGVNINVCVCTWCVSYSVENHMGSLLCSLTTFRLVCVAGCVKEEKITLERYMLPLVFKMHNIFSIL